MINNILKKIKLKGLGEPSLLPIVNCESYIEKSGIRTSVALVSTKQPVPRCPPQQALTILVELQMANSQNNNTNNNQEVKLKSCAWTKIQLFDAKNRLLSGRWKLQLKKLPIQSDANVNTLNSLPDVIQKILNNNYYKYYNHYYNNNYYYYKN